MPPSPCSTLITSKANWFTSAGVSAVNSGLKPLNSTDRSSAGAVRSLGMTPFAFIRSPPPTPSVSAM